MAQNKTKQTKTDPMLEGTGQPGELSNTPTIPSSGQDPALVGTGQPGSLYGTPNAPTQDFLDAMRLEELGIEQDPTLKNTGQPGELYSTPNKPSDSFLKAQNKAAKRKAEIDVGKDFSIWDIAEDLDLDFKPFDQEVE